MKNMNLVVKDFLLGFLFGISLLMGIYIGNFG
jgi:hypothetical protein